uniref:Uncharacterized protein n=1 Tax=Daphnia magna TaxID=35525 RepID=A0A0P6FZF0_9CRUS
MIRPMQSKVCLSPTIAVRLISSINFCKISLSSASLLHTSRVVVFLFVIFWFS